MRYLACMAVKIEHTVGGHNHDILQQCISDEPADVWDLIQSKSCQYICSNPDTCPISAGIAENSNGHWS